MENSLDWSQFVRRINIKAGVDQILSSWTTSEALESWFLRSAEYFDLEGNLVDRREHVKSGYAYEWKWYTYDDYVGRGTVLEIIPGQFFSFTFDLSKVEISVYENQINPQETILQLTQSQIPTDDQNKMRMYVGCSGAWMYHLTNLKSILEGGLDLRGKTTKGMFNN